jgi:hypothetical protein
MTHFYKDLTGDFPQTVGAEGEPVVYWDKKIKFVGLRVDPDAKKTWVFHDWCGGYRDLGDFPTLKDLSSTYLAAGKAICDQLEELVDIVLKNDLPLSVARDAIDDVKKLLGTE